MAGGANYKCVAHPFGMGATVSESAMAVPHQRGQAPKRGVHGVVLATNRWSIVVLATNRWSIGGGIGQCRQAAEATGAQLRRLQLSSHHPKTKVQSGERRQSGVRRGVRAQKHT